MKYADYKAVYVDKTTTLKAWQEKRPDDLLQASISSGKIKQTAVEEQKTLLHLKQAFDVATLREITAKVAMAPVNIQKVWNLAYDHIQIAGKEYTDTSHYSPELHAIFFNLKNDTTSPVFKAYKDFFHEVGHLIDHWLGNHSSYLSVTYRGGILAKTLKGEADCYIKRVREKLKAETDFDAHQKISEEIMGILPYSIQFEVSDIWHGASERKVRGISYHSDLNYWSKDGKSNIPKDAFAHMFGASIYNPESIEKIECYFPKSYNIFREMLDGFLKGDNKK